MNALKRKLELFDLGATAISNLSHHRNLYACPICRTLFTVEAITVGVLTLEHVPQRSQGGRGIALTCKDCNNTAGDSIDAAVDRREKDIAFFEAMAGKASDYRGRARFSVGDTTTNAELKFEQGGFQVEIHQKRNHPESFRKQIDTPHPRSAQLKAHLASESVWAMATIGDLKSAYIAAFASFGYSYALHPRLDLVREQIRSPSERLIQHAHWIASNEFPPGPVILGVIRPFAGLLVRIGKGIIGLPWIEGDGDFYAKLPSLFRDPGTEIKATHLGWPTTLELSRDLEVGTQP
jgi:hypothetical protein